MRSLIGPMLAILTIGSSVHGGDDPRLTKAKPVLDKAIAYLRAQQDEKTGGWAVPKEGPVFPAIASLVVNGMLMEPGITIDDPAVKRGVAFVLKYRQADGGIYDKILPSYNTSICLSMLGRVNTPEAKGAMKPAQEFLKSLQFGEAAVVEGPFAGETGRVGKDHPFYGGVGYGRSGRPDLSNLAFFMQAMADSGLSERDESVQRALVFLKRTQMLGSTNDMPYAAGSTQGGFIYSTSSGKDGVGKGQSYGGEIAESLSGPPGTVAVVVLNPGVDGKRPTLNRDDVKARVQKAMTQSSDTAVAQAAALIVVLPGPSTNGESASEFEIRTSVPDPGILQSVVGAAFDEHGKPTASVTANTTASWQGVSRLRAYGSMSYAGFKSLVYAKLPRDDARVVAAYDWIRHHYTLLENPGLGNDGVYYYYLTFARAMDAWGAPMVDAIMPDGSHESHDWALDLIDALAKLQNPDGSFRSVDDRWMENNPVLITAYAVLALEHAAR